jgi:Asp-tRNA(Asn)/Glu-tRNA(Gln) amidotransferase A subunit family amidase
MSLVTRSVVILTVFIAVFGVLIKLSSEPAPVGGGTLGDLEYASGELNAPVVSGKVLSVFAKILSTPFIGPLTRRILLNDNQMGTIKHLAEQAKSAGYPVMYYPMKRLSSEQQAVHSEAAREAPVEKFVLEGLPKSYSKGFGVVDYANAYRKKKSTPTDQMTQLISAVLSLKEWNMFVQILPDDILEQAAASDKRFAEGKPLSIWDGVPVAVKDMVRVKGHTMFDGKRFRTERNNPAKKDDLIVERFRKLGAIIVGTTVMTEFGVSPLGYNVHYQGPYNPYNFSHYSGGSSAGAAVAVALGIVPMAIGYDGGGSIRIPSAFSGTVGLMPTYGRVADDLGATTMVHGGPIAWSVTDAALAYAVMAPTEPGHFYSRLYGGDSLPAPHLKDFTEISSFKGLRIGVFNDYVKDSDAEVYATFQASLDFFKKLGAEVVEIALPHVRQMRMAHGFGISTEFGHLYDSIYHFSSHEIEPQTLVQLGIGETITGAEFLSANRLRGYAFDFVSKLFESKIDVIMTPTVPIVAPKIPEEVKEFGTSNLPLVVKVMRFIFWSNLIGNPSITIPAGYSETGLPIGVQFMADHWNDALLLRLGSALEQGFLDRRLSDSKFKPYIDP